MSRMQACETRLRLRRRTSAERQRRGVATLWLVLLLPVLLILLVIVVEVGDLMLVRGQLENSVDAAARSAALKWGQTGGGDTTAARTVAVDFAQFNRIGKNQVVALNSNDDTSGVAPNDNLALTGANANLIFGRVTGTNPNYVFEANVEPSVSAGTIRVIASGVFNDLNVSNDFLRVEFLSATPGSTVIREVWIDLQSGSEPGNDALFFFASGSQSSSNPPSLSAAVTFHSSPVTSQPNAGNQVSVFWPIGARTIRIVPPSADFRASTPANFLQISGLGIGLLNLVGAFGGNSATGDGDAFGVYGIQGRVVLQNNPPSGPTTVLPFMFVNDINDRSEVSFDAGVTGDLFGVRVAASASVPSLCHSLFGVPLGPFTVKADSVAIFDPAAVGTKVRPIRINQFVPATIPNSP